jgi:hypothetical protein
MLRRSIVNMSRSGWTSIDLERWGSTTVAVEAGSVLGLVIS